MSDLKAYLASKYMSGAKAEAILDRASSNSDYSDSTAKRRKKKRKVEGGDATERVVAAGGGLIIADDDGMSWAKKDDEDDAEAAPVVEERKGFFKAKAAGTQSWATVRDADPSLAAYENAGRTPSPEPGEDENPYVVSTTVEEAPRGGLQSAAQLRAEQERRKAEQEKLRIQAEREIAKRKKEMQERGEDDDDANDPTATVYRDSSGRKIDMKLEKAEKARLKREEQDREMKKMEWGKGLVQKEDKERERLEQERMAAKPLARYADDEDMNDELKDRERWNDPAAAFLSKDKKASKSKTPKYPAYRGPPPPPNRFGIPPGYRWDGVQRGNGFEAKYLQRGNQAKMHSAAAYEYSTDDM